MGSDVILEVHSGKVFGVVGVGFSAINLCKVVLNR